MIEGRVTLLLHVAKILTHFVHHPGTVIIDQASSLADQQCCKLFMGAHGFTPEWAQLLKEIDFCQTRLRHVKIS